MARGDDLIEGADKVTVEEPLEIRVVHGAAGERDDTCLSVTMRTPGQDAELALGFLLGEGIVAASDDVLDVAHHGPSSPDKGIRNTIRVELAEHVNLDPDALLRHFYVTSSCGVCGKASLDAVRLQITSRQSAPFAASARALRDLPKALGDAQVEFGRTGGLHAAAAFDGDGRIVRLREDIGRHNALDKLVGSFFGTDLLPTFGLLLSGRASFELLQKAAVAGVQMVAAIGAPSSLAVELAREQGMTLLGFLTEDRFNLYSGVERIGASIQPEDS